MAYIVSWDEGVPVGATTPAADIDTELQSLKTSLRERLEQVMPDFDDDLLDPKLLTIQSGTAANLPASPDYQGQLYFAEDTGVLYIGDATPAWVSVGGVVVEGEDPISTTFFVAANKGGDQIIGGSTEAALSGWVVALQYGDWYSGGSPTRFTCSAGGTYELFASLTIGGENITRVRFRVNGSLYVAASVLIQPATNSEICAVIQGAYALSTGDYVELMVETTISIPSITVYGTYSHVKITRQP